MCFALRSRTFPLVLCALSMCAFNKLLLSDNELYEVQKLDYVYIELNKFLNSKVEKGRCFHSTF